MYLKLVQVSADDKSPRVKSVRFISHVLSSEADCMQPRPRAVAGYSERTGNAEVDDFHRKTKRLGLEYSDTLVYSDYAPRGKKK